MYESRLPVGHFGLVVGSTSGTRTWPTTAEWINWQEDLGPEPDHVEPMEAPVLFMIGRVAGLYATAALPLPREVKAAHLRVVGHG